MVVAVPPLVAGSNWAKLPKLARPVRIGQCQLVLGCSNRRMLEESSSGLGEGGEGVKLGGGKQASGQIEPGKKVRMATEVPLNLCLLEQ